jgi:hypothetical protein
MMWNPPADIENAREKRKDFNTGNGLAAVRSAVFYGWTMTLG